MADELKVAESVLTSENATTFYAERLGLADPDEPTEAVVTAEPEQTEQSEPEAEEDAQKQDSPKDKLNKRFDKLTAKNRDLENRLKEYEARANQPEPAPQEPAPQGKPTAAQFNDAFEYAEALAEWSAENALKQRDIQDANRRNQEAEAKKNESWNKKLEKAKAEMPDFDRIVQSSDIVVSDEIKRAILESDVGPEVLYHLASNEDFAKKLTEMDSVKALKEIGKLEGRFEVKEEPKKIVSSSKAPDPIRPLTGGKVGNDVLLDTNGEFHGTYSQWKAARQAGKVR